MPCARPTKNLCAGMRMRDDTRLKKRPEMRTTWMRVKLIWKHRKIHFIRKLSWGECCLKMPGFSKDIGHHEQHHRSLQLQVITSDIKSPSWKASPLIADDHFDLPTRGCIGMYPSFPYAIQGHYSENPYLITLIFWIAPQGLHTEDSGMG